ncbi:MAG: helix-turn-helix domain-containing protein [Anaerolineae bacterium]
MTFDDLLTAQEVADYLGLHLVTVRDMLRTGKLPGRKVGREWRTLRSELEAWLRQPEPVGDSEPEK